MPALTGLRFFAALHVVLLHFVPEEIVPAWAHPYLSNGWSAVALFFVLSGFIMAYTYLGRPEESSFDIRGFAVSRFARIYPVFFLSAVLYAPFSILPGLMQGAVDPLLLYQTGSMLTLSHSWHIATAQGPNPPSWSLSAEAFFYLVFALGMAWMPLRQLVRRAGDRLVLAGAVLLATTLSLAVWNHGSDSYTGHWIRYFFPPSRLPEFLFGIVVGLAFLRYQAGPARPLAAAWRFFTRPEVAVGLSLVVLYVSAAAGLDSVLTSALCVPLFGALIFGLSRGEGLLVRVLSHRGLVLLGGASYALYLLHFPLFTWLTAVNKRTLQLETHDWPFILLFLFSVNAASILVFLAFEEPARRAIRARFNRPKVESLLPGGHPA